MLEALPEAAWRGLKHAPAWAVVRALGDTAGPDLVYLRALEALARSLARWAAPRTERIRLERAPDPGRVGALLARWRWPAAEPPLAMVAAYADTARTDITDDAWAAELRNAQIFVAVLGAESTSKTSSSSPRTEPERSAGGRGRRYFA